LPFLFVYIRYLTGNIPRKRAVMLLYFIPALISYIYHVPFIIIPSLRAMRLYKYLIDTENSTDYYFVFTFIIIFIIGFSFLAFSLLTIRQHHRRIKDKFSSIEKINLKWVNILFSGITLLWIIVLLPFNHNELIIRIFSKSLDNLFDQMSGVLLVIFIFFIGYFGIRQTDIFISNDSEGIINRKNRGNKKYTGSYLTDEFAADLQEQVLHVIETEKLYLKSEITLGELADILKTNTSYISQVINERLNTTFWDLINDYRVKEFTSRIHQILDKSDNILSLAYFCGFNSKSAFNNIFKKHTGLTPGEFIRKKAEHEQ
jgi:AraC-like DNA-binding protein